MVSHGVSTCSGIDTWSHMVWPRVVHVYSCWTIGTLLVLEPLVTVGPTCGRPGLTLLYLVSITALMSSSDRGLFDKGFLFTGLSIEFPFL